MNAQLIDNDLPLRETIEGLIARYGVRATVRALIAAMLKPRAPARAPDALPDHIRRDIGLEPLPKTPPSVRHLR